MRMKYRSGWEDVEAVKEKLGRERKNDKKEIYNI